MPPLLAPRLLLLPILLFVLLSASGTRAARNIAFIFVDEMRLPTVRDATRHFTPFMFASLSSVR